MKPRICHISTAHRGLDVRIFHKQCISLSDSGYDVTLIIEANESQVEFARSYNVKIFPLSESNNRLTRMLLRPWRAFLLALKSRAKVYHFHDPELIPVGIALRLAGFPVIYDVHEDLPRDIYTKAWIPSYLHHPISKLIDFLEGRLASQFFHVVTSTPVIKRRFLGTKNHLCEVKNFPQLAEFASVGNTVLNVRHSTVPYIAYVGSIAEVRGIREVVRALELLGGRCHLHLAGVSMEQGLMESLRSEPGWEYVVELGFLDRNAISQLLTEALAGVVTLHPTRTYLDSYPVKLFEYMASGLPVIASDFPLWRELLAAPTCAILVNPLDPGSVADGIKVLLDDPDLRLSLGSNGRNKVLEKYNWESEMRRLVNLYSSILKEAS